MTRTLLFGCLAAVLVAPEPAGAVLEGLNATEEFDLFVRDFEAGTITPRQAGHDRRDAEARRAPRHPPRGRDRRRRTSSAPGRDRIGCP